MKNSGQLELPLVWARNMPWQGASPRLLTRGAKGLFLRRKPQKDDRFFVDPDQFDLFRAAIKGRRRYGGAPLLQEGFKDGR